MGKERCSGNGNDIDHKKSNSNEGGSDRLEDDGTNNSREKVRDEDDNQGEQHVSSSIQQPVELPQPHDRQTRSHPPVDKIPSFQILGGIRCRLVDGLAELIDFIAWLVDWISGVSTILVGSGHKPSHLHNPPMSYFAPR